MHKLKIILSAFLTGILLNASSQQMNYSAGEAYAIHDSINKSRWDVGGRLSHYSFRFMSEFFPVAVIEKPAAPYQYAKKPYLVSCPHEPEFNKIKMVRGDTNQGKGKALDYEKGDKYG